MNIGDVLCTNYGTKSWKLTSPDDYSALEWYDVSTKPTEEELRNELSNGNLENWFRCMEFCDKIYIYDQASDDGSLEYYEKFNSTHSR